MSGTETVNPHYLGHVIDVGDTHDVEVSEDIVAGNGVKLLAKGAKISRETRERLLQHKLRKPLEDCVRVASGVTPQRLAETAEALIERHALLRELNGKDTKAVNALRKLNMSPAMQSLLTVYCEHRPDKISHAVGAALLAHALALRLAPHAPDQHATLLMAGLFHDVGELYIDPGFFEKGKRLNPDQWKHIATHPIVAHRLLKDMVGGGILIADAVLQHHERLDGFGYPLGLRGDRVGTPGQILSVAELLLGLLESAAHPLTSAAVAMKLIPGEFSRGTLDAVVTASQLAGHSAAEAEVTPLAQSLSRVQRIAGTLRRFHDAGMALQQEMEKASPGLKSLIGHGVERLHRIQLAFSSTGLDSDNPEGVIERLTAPGSETVQREANIVLREIEWRLKELERESLLRAERLPPGDARVVQRLVTELRGSPVH